MRIARWAAIAVTLLMGLANLGVITEGKIGLTILGLVLASAAAIAVYGITAQRSWGVAAVIAVGVVNLAAAIVTAIAGLDGWPVGVVLSGLAIVLTTVTKPTTRPVVTS
jgi:hypothetical protein